MATSKTLNPNDYVPIPNSGIQQPSNTVRLQDPDPKEVIRVVIVVRSRRPEVFTRAAVLKLAMQLPVNREYLSIEKSGQEFGASREDLAQVASFATQSGFRILIESSRRRCVIVEGTRETFSRTFRVQFHAYAANNGLHYMSYSGTIQIPCTLKDIIKGVFGFDTCPRAQCHATAVRKHHKTHTNPTKMAAIYDFPPDVSGRGQCIGIVELGGGFRPADINAYFKRHKMPVPRITVVCVDGATNDPATPAEVRRFWKSATARHLRHSHHSNKSITGDPDLDAKVTWTIECTMDVQLAGMLANGADIVVYLAPNTTKGKYDALTTALSDTKNRPSIISCSWGSTELDHTQDMMHVFDRLFQHATLKGVTMCMSSGDNGVGGNKRQPQVNFPASSPYVLSCGGSELKTNAPKKKERVWKEVVFSEFCSSTGGFSRVFSPPVWQRKVKHDFASARGRYGVPNVAAKADLADGYCIRVGGLDIAMGGTSAAAPLWAALIARLNEKMGVRAGFINALLYRSSFRETTSTIHEGDNGFYRAGKGWCACTGWGSPKGMELFQKLSGG